MLSNFRQFQVTDPFGRVWQVEFRWLQNAISIRHADTVDCKYYLTDGNEKRELIIALPHAVLVALAYRTNRELTDAWCMKLASLHVERLISTWEDLDKTIVVPPVAELEKNSLELDRSILEEAERAALHH